MTIAAGFRADGGVLLCADQLHLAPDGFKTYSPKVSAWIAGPWRCGFAYAGNKANSEIAIRNLVNTIERSGANVWQDLVEPMSRSVLSTARSYIDRHPASERDAYCFELLIALNRPPSGDVGFLATSNGALNPVAENYAFTGVGSSYGECVGRVASLGTLSLDVAILLGSRSIATAKRYTNDCGGPSNFVFIYNEAKPTIPIASFNEPFIEDYVVEYETTMDRILLMCANPTSTIESVRKELDDLARSAELMKFTCRTYLGTTVSILKGRIPIARRSDPQSPTTGQSPPPPSPESPEESGES